MTVTWRTRRPIKAGLAIVNAFVTTLSKTTKNLKNYER
jgi:hypothetical protein